MTGSNIVCNNKQINEVKFTFLRLSEKFVKFTGIHAVIMFDVFFIIFGFRIVMVTVSPERKIMDKFSFM